MFLAVLIIAYITMKYIDKILKLAEYFLSLADKEKYQLEQEYLESSPKELDKHLDDAKERQRRWREKNKELLEQRREQYRAIEWEKKKALLKEDSLDGKLLLLKSQIAFRKKDIKKKNNPELLQKYEVAQKQVNDFVFLINEYLYGIHHSNKAYIAKPEQLYSLITKAKSMGPIFDIIGSPTINKTFTDLIVKLQEHADNLTQR